MNRVRQELVASRHLRRESDVSAGIHKESVNSGDRCPRQKRFHHPIVGDLTLVYEELAITAEPGQVLLIYSAEPGSPSAERLRLLAS